jgi:hypothetical protein
MSMMFITGPRSGWQQRLLNDTEGWGEMDNRDLPGPDLTSGDIRRWIAAREEDAGHDRDLLIPEITTDDIRRWLEKKKRAQK